MIKNHTIDPGETGDDSDMALNAALAAADEDMLTAVSNGLDLDKGLTQILKNLPGAAGTRPDAKAPAHSGEDQKVSSTASSQKAPPRVHARSGGGTAIDVAVLIREVNATNNAVEDQWLRARQAADTAIRSDQAAGEAKAAAQAAAIAYQTIQAERPRRRSPLPRQAALAAGTVAFDGVACYFAAQALNGSQNSTLIWTVLFLAVLVGGEIGLDFYRDRNLRAWRILACVTSAFVVLLGVLRFWSLAIIGSGDLITAFTGAALFTVTTAGFLTVGYRILRAAETPRAWRARRAAHAATQAARTARTVAKRDAAERDRLTDAYLRQVRKVVLRTCASEQQMTIEQQMTVESVIRQHLSGELSSGEEESWRLRAPRPGS